MSTALDDMAPVVRDAQAARRLGLGAKLSIHPRQVAELNAGFPPTDAELAWVRRVLAAVERSDSTAVAVAVDGKMTDKPVLLRARAVLGRGGWVVARHDRCVSERGGRGVWAFRCRR